MTNISYSSKYRPDVDGLRALAVLSVVGYHAFPKVVKGGFVGVDVFFVISGFLITSIIVSGLESNSFSFLDFYSRRIRRIFPALLLVMVSSLAVGWFVLLADEYKQLGKHVAAGAGFISNFVFWREANYFDNAADTKILLHLWSLGVEEQYYFIWPALVWGAWKKGFNRISICIFILLISFAVNVTSIGTNALSAFYSPLSRFWELLAGGLLAYLTLLKPARLARLEARISSWVSALIFQPGHRNAEIGLRDAAAMSGILLLAISVKFITQGRPFPGWWALLPTVGAYLILFAGPRAWFNRKVLSNRILVWFGLISYPLYLWHWPLLVFARNMEGETPSPKIRIALVLASIALAWLTYRLIEIPIRFGIQSAARVFALCTLMICVGGLGYYDFEHDGLGFRFEERNEYASYFDSNPAGDRGSEIEQLSQNQCNFLNLESPLPTIVPRKSINPECYTKHTAKSILLWGDSHAAHLYYGLKQVLPKDISTLLVFSSGCMVRPVIEANIEINHCEKANSFALSVIKENVPEIVMLASNYSFDINQIREIASLLKQYGVKRIFVLGQVPHWKPDLFKIVIKNYWDFTPRYIPGHQDLDILAIGNEFKSKMTRDDVFEYIDLQDFFCNTDGCLAYLGDNRRDGLVTLDTAHLRPFASVYLAKNLLAPLILKQFRN